jgi:hypothetical protein
MRDVAAPEGVGAENGTEPDGPALDLALGSASRLSVESITG